MSSAGPESSVRLSRHDRRVQKGELALLDRLVEHTKNVGVEGVDAMYMYAPYVYGRRDWELPDSAFDLPEDLLRTLQTLMRARKRFGEDAVSRVVSRYHTEVARTEKIVTGEIPVGAELVDAA